MGCFRRTVVATALLTWGRAIASTSHDVGVYCKLLDAQIPDRVVFPGSAPYNSSDGSYFCGQESDLQPGCIFQPQATSEVAHFMRLITSRVDGCATQPRFAVRCGGHTAFANAANVDGGITVDMRAMDTVTVNGDLTVASIGGGGIWANVYNQLSPLNVTVMGGRQQGLGVGGLGTGGGIHFLSREYGWVCDNIYEYEVVLANGSVISATASSHRDLWLALKGGSNNFGIVTRFDAAIFDLNAMWGGEQVLDYTPAVVEAHAQAFSNFMLPENFDPKAHGVTLLVYSAGKYSVVDTIYYTEPIENPPAWRNFTSIQPQIASTLGVSTAAKLTEEGKGTLPTNKSRADALTFTFQTGPPEVYSELFSIWEEGTKALANITDVVLVFLVQPKPVTNGTNAMDEQPYQKNLMIAGHQNNWANTADDEAVTQGVNAIIQKQVAYLKQRGLYVPFKYLNYADITQDVIGSWGTVAVTNLQAASRQYDPYGVFQTQISGGFKLGM